MTDTDVIARLALLKQDLWSFDAMRERFGIDFSDGESEIRKQFEQWAKDYSPGVAALDLAKTKANRNLFELFLQKRDLIDVRSASIQLGMDESSFKIALDAFRSNGYISRAEADGDFPNIYRVSLLDAFRERLPKLAQKVFGSYTSFIEQLHAEIRESLKVQVTTLYDLTSKALEENPVECAHEYDAISGEPMGLPFKVWLETNKPIQLRPDCCSWLTYVEFEPILSGERLGRPDEELEKYRDAIERTISH